MPTATLFQPIDIAIRELHHVDQATQDRLRDLGASVMPLQMLKRTGQRPFLFNGAVVATVTGVTPLLPFWYELNLHRTVLGEYVSDVRLFNTSVDRPDLFWVAEHPDLDAALLWFERYDPAGDITPPGEFALPAANAVELALQLARLQLQVHQHVQHYRALVGELLTAVTPRA